MAYEREKPLTTFERHNEFVEAQTSLINLDLFVQPTPEEDTREEQLLQKLTVIFSTYQEQSYLLDPFLESLVFPVVDKLKEFARDHLRGGRSPSGGRIRRLSLLLYGYIKFRGHKTITRFFPHEIADMPIALDFMLIQDSVIQHPSQWALRYAVMLWLSLIIRIPFDLAQFDDEDNLGHTAKSLEIVGKAHIGKAGLERDSAALVLSRLYMRKDLKQAFPDFVRTFKTQIRSQTIDVLMAIGFLQVINEVAKTGPVHQVKDSISDYVEIIEAAGGTATFSGNALFRKMKVKLASRAAVRMLPAANVRRRRALAGSSESIVEEGVSGEFEVPEVVEALLQHLFDAVQDKDTVVRWSAAKGVARLAERLPQSFASQVLDTVLEMFSIHSMAAATLSDLPAIAESTWHGAALACAEMARRGLVGSDQLPHLINWMSKALYFDLRKGSHSIGSNVRDAAAYVLWSLARTQDVGSLRPHADNLARQLVTVALFDREIHIRRAASAAFQEHVGRTSLFPHGIDVLKKTDFYAVSGRRNAFLVAAPQVAEHPEYRPYLIDHLLKVVLRHWDSGMRELGSQSLRAICEVDLLQLGPIATKAASGLLKSVDTADVHGGLLALGEISLAYRNQLGNTELQEQLLQEILSHLASVSQDVLFGPRNGIVTAAACHMIGNAITLADIELQPTSTSNWRKVIDYGLHYRLDTVQEAAAVAYATISKRQDLSDDIKKLIKDLKSASPITQQSLPRVLGLIDYNKCQGCLTPVLGYLLDRTKKSSNALVEVRRSCYQALPQILHTLLPNLSDRLSPPLVQNVFETLLLGLNDYTIDERGDVGSWIRIVCVQGLTSCIEDLFSVAKSIENFEEYLPLSKYHQAVAGILKQSVERLDNVRQEAGSCFLRLLKLTPVRSTEVTWSLPGRRLLEELFLEGEQGGVHQSHFLWLPPHVLKTELLDWADGPWLFPRAVRLLDIPEYRPSVLKGLVHSLSCKTDSTQRPAAKNFAAYAKSLPISGDGYTLVNLVGDIITAATINLASNTVVIPTLQTFTILLESDALRLLGDNPEGVESLASLLDLATKNVGRLKNVQRIQESMKIAVNLITFRAVANEAIAHLGGFLAHPYPRIRGDTAEYLYLLLQGTDALEIDDNGECVLLETEWSSENTEIAKASSSKIVESLLMSIS